jgi:hypothetical protein
VRRLRALLIIAAIGVVGLGACQSPTEVILTVRTDVPCTMVQGTTVTTGTLGAIERKPQATDALQCDGVDGNGYFGNVVLVPSGSNTDELAMKVVTGVGQAADQCAPDANGQYGKGCIVARRSLRYIPHETLRVNVIMRSSCNGISCGPTETCVRGSCVSAQIPDPSACSSAEGCSEDVLGAPLPPETDGGPGDSNTETGTDAASDASVCTTRITGTVMGPSGAFPIYNATVYVPMVAPAAFSPGLACGTCGQSPSGGALATTVTGADGTFTLTGPQLAGSNVPLVVQVGRWRRQAVVTTVTACSDNVVPVASTRLPKNTTEGDIPLMAVSTGGGDALECLLRRIGLDDTVFSTNAGFGRVQLYAGTGGSSAFYMGPTFAASSTLWANKTSLSKYDLVLLSCEGVAGTATGPELQAMSDYMSAGGRVVGTHFHSYWFSNGPAPLPTTATWNARAAPPSPVDTTVATGFPKGAAFAQWLVHAGASGVAGTLTAQNTAHGADAVSSPTASWLSAVNNNAGGITAIELLTFNAPVGAPASSQCGRGVYSGLHSTSGVANMPFPSGCSSAPLTANELALAFMLFDAAACVQPDALPPMPPPL